MTIEMLPVGGKNECVSDMYGYTMRVQTGRLPIFNIHTHPFSLLTAVNPLALTARISSQINR